MLILYSIIHIMYDCIIIVFFLYNVIYYNDNCTCIQTYEYISVYIHVHKATISLVALPISDFLPEVFFSFH